MVRSHNEDSVAVADEVGLFVLADGMGGYNAGEVASGMATTLLRTELTKDLQQWRTELLKAGTGRLHKLLQARVGQTNQAIYLASQHQPQYEGMGTTLVLAVLQPGRLTAAHLGDSRCYRLRGDQFTQITKDHSLLQEQLEAGVISEEMAKISRNKSLVTRALGVDPDIQLELHDHEVEPGDIYLMCSDGLSDMVEDKEIQLALTSLSNNLDLAADTLIQMANDAGGRDNVSVVLIKIEPESKQGRGLFLRLLEWLK
jgi:protein phosphatase